MTAFREKNVREQLKILIDIAIIYYIMELKIWALE
jgi:hypothetical protein